MISVSRARDLLDRFASLRVLVAGDLMLDEFLWGNVTRISPEAPVPVVQVTGQSYFSGGAANVARNLAEFTPHASVMGLCGSDSSGTMLQRLLSEAGIDHSAVIQDPDRATILKTRIIARHQQVVRVDRESAMQPTPAQLENLLRQLEQALVNCDALILSDYAKGFLSQEFCDEAGRLARLHNKIVTVDPSPKNPFIWNGVTAVKPNLEEACAAAGISPMAPATEAGLRLLELWGTDVVLLTMGERGMMLFRRGEEPYHTPTRAREVFDVSGAGDTAIATFTLALAAGATPNESAELANHASGVAVGKLGTATVKPAEILDSIQGH